MAKNIVICCDGTGNQVNGYLSNVLKLFQIVEKDATQRVYYSCGIGTIGTDDRWARYRQNVKAVFGLASGYGLDNDVLDAYRFLAAVYEDGDSVFLLGFSRGSYTLRVLAGFIHMVGLLPPDQMNIAGYALVAYKRASEQNDLTLGWDFSRITGSRRILIKFIGLWDTVASIIVPRRDRLIPSLQKLPYTRRNPSVEIFRHAMSIDERRRLFRLNHWLQPQDFVADPFNTHAPKVAQDIKQVWFAGVHSDVGGGYPESESGLAKFPLAWLIDEATDKGLRINAALRDHLVFGKPYLSSRRQYVAPNAAAEKHESLTWAWKLIEWIPKRMKYEEWPDRTKFDGFYIPCGEPRMIENSKKPGMPENPVKPRIHQSVLDRKISASDYNPVNFPAQYDVEPWPYAPGSGAPAPVEPPAA